MTRTCRYCRTIDGLSRGTVGYNLALPLSEVPDLDEPTICHKADEVDREVALKDEPTTGSSLSGDPECIALNSGRSQSEDA